MIHAAVPAAVHTTGAVQKSVQVNTVSEEATGRKLTNRYGSL